MRKKKQVWQSGDIFSVELEDGSYCLGLILLSDLEKFDGPLCALSTNKVSDLSNISEIEEADIKSVLFTSSDQLDKSGWQVVGHQSIKIYEKYYARYLEDGFTMIGVELIGSGIVRRFMDACFGLYPWDGFFEKDFLDKLLLAGVKRPDQVIFK